MARPMQDCVVLMGDSLTQRTDSPGNLHQRMIEAYERKLDILNRGYGGFNTAWTVPLLDQTFARKTNADHSPVVRLVTLWFGTNDCTLPSRDQHLPIEQFRKNMTIIFDALTSPDSPYAIADTPVSVVLITPGPCLLCQMEAEKRPHRTLERTKQFRDEILRLGEEWKKREKALEKDLKHGEWGWKVATVDFWKSLVGDAGGEGDELAPYFIDGLHLSNRGYTVLWDELARAIKTEFKGRGLDWDDFDDLPRRVPWFGDIDFKRPKSVVERMALPVIRGGRGPIDVGHAAAFEG